MRDETDFRAVLFDLDGTLLDTLDDLCDATNTVLARFGFPTHPQRAYRQMVGQGIRVLATLALPEENRDEQTIGRVQGDLDRYLREHPVMKSKPYPEVPALLSRLQERIIPMSILTNKPDSLARAVVAQLLDGWSFKGIQGQREDVPRKPDPTAAISLSDVMGVAPTQIVFVGDSDIDMQTALAAGMTPVGVAWGFRGRVELDAAGAKRIISRPLDLLELFERR